MTFRCWQARRVIRRLFVDQGLPAGCLRRLWLHLRDCQHCQARYDAVIEAQRLVEHAGAEAAPSNISRLELQMARQLAIPGGAPHEATDSPLRTAWLTSRMSLSLLAAASVAVVVGVVATNLRRSHEMDDWHTRGVSSAMFAIRVFCEGKGDAGEPRYFSVSDSAAPDDKSACPRTSSLRFGYLSEEPGFIFVFVREANGDIVLVDELDGENPIPIVATAQLSSLEWSLRLQHWNDRQHLTLIFVRSQSAQVDVDSIKAALRSRSSGVVVLERIVRLEPLSAYGQ